jgi:hypothetical protein
MPCKLELDQQHSTRTHTHTHTHTRAHTRTCKLGRLILGSGTFFAGAMFTVTGDLGISTLGTKDWPLTLISLTRAPAAAAGLPISLRPVIALAMPSRLSSGCADTPGQSLAATWSAGQESPVFSTQLLSLAIDAQQLPSLAVWPPGHGSAVFLEQLRGLGCHVPMKGQQRISYHNL